MAGPRILDLEARVQQAAAQRSIEFGVEWKGASKGYKLTDKASYKFLEAAQKYGIVLCIDESGRGERAAFSPRIFSLVSKVSTEPVSLERSSGISNAMNLSMSHLGVQIPPAARTRGSSQNIARDNHPIP
jgi:hypothetical protein